MFEEGFSFSPLGETGEGFVDQLTNTTRYNERTMPAKNIIPGQKVSREKQQRSRELRHDVTPAEKLLWHELRANKLGVHFRRQQVISGFIVDFYCHKADLVVEVDGDIHDLQKEEDIRRENTLKELGLRVIRFRNEEVLNNLPSVLENIRKQIITMK
jgi:very-short-patch-repair endonuclease